MGEEASRRLYLARLVYWATPRARDGVCHAIAVGDVSTQELRAVGGCSSSCTGREDLVDFARTHRCLTATSVLDRCAMPWPCNPKADGDAGLERVFGAKLSKMREEDLGEGGVPLVLKHSATFIRENGLGTEGEFMGGLIREQKKKRLCFSIVCC